MSADSKRPAPVVPLHKRAVAGPRKVVRQPSSLDLEYHAQVVRERETYVNNHPLVRQNPEPELHHAMSAAGKLNLVKARMARETVVLEFNRMEMEKRGVETSQVSTRIVASLGKIADIELEIKKLGHVVLDPHSTEVQNILKMWLEALRTTTSQLVEDGSMSTQTMDLFFNMFSNKMEGWEDRLEES